MVNPNPALSQKKYYVYTLAYPDGTVFYVGKGTGRRVHLHELYAARSDEMIKYLYLNDRKCSVIRQIWASNEQVKKDILYETDNEQDAYLYEWTLINIIYADSEYLTNDRTRGPKRPFSLEHSKFESDGEVYYTAPKAAHYLGISPRNFNRNVRDKLQAYNHEARKRLVYFRQSDLDKIRSSIVSDLDRVEDGETYYTAAEAARYLRIARDTFNRNVRDRIPVYHLGALRREFFRQSDLDRYKGARPVEDEDDENI